MSGRERLADRDWLADRYANASSTTIAEELGVAPSTVVNALHRHGITVRDRWSSARLRIPPEIDDADWRSRTPGGVPAAHPELR